MTGRSAPLYTEEQLSAMTVAELKVIADSLGIKGLSSAKKAEIIDAILAVM